MSEQTPYLTLRQVSEHTGIPLQTLYRYRSEGTGPTGLKIGGVVRIHRDDLDAWLAQFAERTAS